MDTIIIDVEGADILIRTLHVMKCESQFSMCDFFLLHFRRHTDAAALCAVSHREKNFCEVRMRGQTKTKLRRKTVLESLTANKRLL
jgi:hypothetical protein